MPRRSAVNEDSSTTTETTVTSTIHGMPCAQINSSKSHPTSAKKIARLAKFIIVAQIKY